MHPSKFGDTYDIAKLRILTWLVPGEKWLIHPMYFPPGKEDRDETFPCRYADFLGLCLVSGNIVQRRHLVNAVVDDPGNLFLDPDTGLRLGDNKLREYVSVSELIEIASARKRDLVLVYNQRINFDVRKAGTRRHQVKEKLDHLHDANVHAVAYVSHVAFIWASIDPNVVKDATRRIQKESRLPSCCFVDDGCGHMSND